MSLYFKSLHTLKKFDVEKSSLTTTELHHVSCLAKFCGIQFLFVLLCWGPYALLCIFTLLASAKDINIFLSMAPPIMAKVC